MFPTACLQRKVSQLPFYLDFLIFALKILLSVLDQEQKLKEHLLFPLEGEENFVGDSEIIALGGASNETKDRPLG